MANSKQALQDMAKLKTALDEWSLQFPTLAKAKSFLSYKAEISASLAEKLFNGKYESQLGSHALRRICNVIKIKPESVAVTSRHKAS